VTETSSRKQLKFFWDPRPGMGPNELKVVTAYAKLSEEDKEAEAGSWIMARLDAILADCDLEIKASELIK